MNVASGDGDLDVLEALRRRLAEDAYQEALPVAHTFIELIQK